MQSQKGRLGRHRIRDRLVSGARLGRVMLCRRRRHNTRLKHVCLIFARHSIAELAATVSLGSGPESLRPLISTPAAFRREALPPSSGPHT